MERRLRQFSAWALALTIAAVGAPFVSKAGDDSDVSAGQSLFRSQCMGCHSLEPDNHRAGPSLHGLFGRPAGGAPDFSYSPAMRDADIVWSEETLDRFLADPEDLVPGTVMVFWGLEAEERAQVIRYLEHATQ